MGNWKPATMSRQQRRCLINTRPAGAYCGRGVDCSAHLLDLDPSVKDILQVSWRVHKLGGLVAADSTAGRLPATLCYSCAAPCTCVRTMQAASASVAGGWQSFIAKDSEGCNQACRLRASHCIHVCIQLYISQSMHCMPCSESLRD